MQACAAAPSASAWLGVAGCRMALDDLDAAGQALTEAVQLDPEHPGVWGRIALVASKGGRAEEAAAALKVRGVVGGRDAWVRQEYGVCTAPLRAQMDRRVERSPRVMLLSSKAPADSTHRVDPVIWGILAILRPYP